MRGHQSRLRLTPCSELRMLEIVAAARDGPIPVSWVTKVAGVISAIRLRNCPTLNKSVCWSWFKKLWPRHNKLTEVSVLSWKMVSVYFEKEDEYYAQIVLHDKGFQVQLMSKTISAKRNWTNYLRIVQLFQPDNLKGKPRLKVGHQTVNGYVF